MEVQEKLNGGKKAFIEEHLKYNQRHWGVSWLKEKGELGQRWWQ